MHAKKIGRMKTILSKQQTEVLVHAVITETKDYCNSFLINTSQSNLYKLHEFQNMTARFNGSIQQKVIHE